ncbi:MAG: MATE family efflux transporter [Gemmatimonadetes bacterium]|nr:MAG: MATE family efflux transporter [Gemmatimonadota bacterium]
MILMPMAKRTTKADYILEGSMARAVFHLAAPAITSQLLATTLTIVDRLWIGRLGADAMAALGAAMFLLWILYALSGILQVGTVSLVARFVGMRDLPRAVHVAQQALTFGCFGSAIVTVFGINGLVPLFQLMDLTPAVAILSYDYMQIFLASSLLMFLLPVQDGILRGSGDTKTPMKVMFLVTVINLVLDPILIFGWGPIPALGVTGAALASVFAQLTGVTIFFVLLTGTRLRLRVPFEKQVQLNFRTLHRIVKIGLPPSVAGLCFLMIYIVITKIINMLDATYALAALTIGITVESLSYLVSVGFATAASTIVGQNLGANQLARAEAGAWMSAKITVWLMMLTTLVYLIFPEWIARIFSSDPQVIEIASRYIRIASFAQMFMGLGIVIDGAFSGAGDTVPPMIISSTFAISRAPFAYVLSIVLEFGVDAVWWVISLSAVFRGITSAIWFARGRWKNKLQV